MSHVGTPTRLSSGCQQRKLKSDVRRMAFHDAQEGTTFRVNDDILRIDTRLNIAGNNCGQFILAMRQVVSATIRGS